MRSLAIEHFKEDITILEVNYAYKQAKGIKAALCSQKKGT